MIKVREWEKNTKDKIIIEAVEIKDQLSTKYHNVGEYLPMENIQEGLFDAKPKKFPSEELVRSMAELRASCCSLIVKANLKLSTTAYVRKKETIHKQQTKQHLFRLSSRAEPNWRQSFIRHYAIIKLTQK